MQMQEPPVEKVQTIEHRTPTNRREWWVTKLEGNAGILWYSGVTEATTLNQLGTPDSGCYVNH